MLSTPDRHLPTSNLTEQIHQNADKAREHLKRILGPNGPHYPQRGTTATIRDVLVRHASRKSHLHTDESNFYPVTGGGEFASHGTVKHTAGEYARYVDGGAIHTNTIENVFSVLKRGMRGTYQHCGEAHLHRYLAEFEFRYNNRWGLGIEDTERTRKTIEGAKGKRLTYRSPDEATNA